MARFDCLRNVRKTTDWNGLQRVRGLHRNQQGLLTSLPGLTEVHFISALARKLRSSPV
jgi:hypothetical protein